MAALATEGRLHAGPLERGLYAIGGLGIAAGLIVLLVDPAALGMDGGAWRESGLHVLGAAALYVLSHALRILRLAYLMVHPTVRTRRAVTVHWYCTGLSAILPFKLSELVRIRQVGLARSNSIDGLLIVWVERVLDAVILSVLVVLALISGVDAASQLTTFLLVSSVFALVTVFAATVVPTNTRDIMLHLVRRDYEPWSLQALRALRALLSGVERVPRIVGRKLPTLLVITAGIWGAEVAALQLVLQSAGIDLAQTAQTLLTALAGFSFESIAISPAAGTRLAEALPTVDPASLSTYRTIVLGTALVGGSAVAAIATGRALRGRSAW